MSQAPSFFLLSVREPWAGRIVSGLKRWEFRANPRFGEVGGRSLRTGDVLFLVGMEESGGRIVGWAEVGRILRDPEMSRLFGDPGTGLWREVGSDCPDHASFLHEVAGRYATAVELFARPLSRPIDVARITRVDGTPWSGKGFNHVDQLGRFRADGRSVKEFLMDLYPEGPGIPSAADRE